MQTLQMEVKAMEPTDPIVSSHTSSNPIFAQFAAGVFSSDMERDNYLSGLDSDTREYVLKNTDDFRTIQDIEDCINKLRGN